MNNEEGTKMMKLSARNVLKGTVKKVTPGVVNTEVVVELPGGIQIVSIITKQSAEAMKIAEGKEISAVIKASNVLLAIECEGC
jgi:molybdopterin-binding protein